MNSQVQQHDGKIAFLQLTRILLTNHPFFAQLLATLPKKASLELAFPFVLSWSKGKPILLYHNTNLSNLLKGENRAVEQILHELLHLLLIDCSFSKYEKNDRFFDAVMDIKVWSWLSLMVEKTPDYLQAFKPIFEEAQQMGVDELLLLVSNNKLYSEAALKIDQSHFLSHLYWKNNTNENRLIQWQLWWSQLKESLPVELLEQGLIQKLKIQSKLSQPLPWRIILRRFANNAVRTFNKNSLRRPSKRYGSIPGIVRKRRQKLLIIVDTSGSVEAAELQLFFNEIHWLYRQGAQIALLQADCKIQSILEYKGKMPKWIWGRGGTAFDPALTFANKNGPFDGVLYFTDGQGEVPLVICQYPLLWVFTANQKPEKFKDWQGQTAILQ